MFLTFYIYKLDVENNFIIIYRKKIVGIQKNCGWQKEVLENEKKD